MSRPPLTSFLKKRPAPEADSRSGASSGRIINAPRRAPTTPDAQGYGSMAGEPAASSAFPSYGSSTGRPTPTGNEQRGNGMTPSGTGGQAGTFAAGPAPAPGSRLGLKPAPRPASQAAALPGQGQPGQYGNPVARAAPRPASVMRPGIAPPVNGRTRGGTGSFLDFLRVDDKLAALLPAATRMASLQSDCAALLPDMFRACAVLQFADGQLVLAVPNAAIAARLRQKLPKLQESLGQKGWKVDQVRLKVQVSAIVPKTVFVKQAVLPKLGLDAMADLESALGESPLKAALARLLRHQRG